MNFDNFLIKAKIFFPSLKQLGIQASPWMSVTLTHRSSSHLFRELDWKQAEIWSTFEHPPACFSVPDLLSCTVPQQDRRNAQNQSRKKSKANIKFILIQFILYLYSLISFVLLNFTGLPLHETILQTAIC